MTLRFNDITAAIPHSLGSWELQLTEKFRESLLDAIFLEMFSITV